MLRSVSIVVSALFTSLVQAQETKAAEAAATKSDASSESVERPMLVASRTNPSATADTRATAPASGGSPGAKPGTPVEPADCSAVESFLEGTNLVVRTYEAPATPPSKGWMRAPFVAAVARCGRLYILQVRSW